MSRPLPRIGWVTNLAAPYRRPIWESLARSADLHVFLLENRSRFERGRGNRASEWMSWDNAPVAVSEVPTVRLTAGERQLYLPRAVGRLPGKGFDALVLTGWESPAYWTAAARGRRWGARLIGFYESTLATHAFRRGPIASVRKRFLRGLDAVLAPGPAAKEALLSMGVDASKIFVGFNPVDVLGIHARAHQARASAAVGDRRANGHRYLYLGQLIERKNVAGLIEAFARLADGDSSLTIAGSGHLLESLCALCDQLGLRDRVAFVGPVPYERVPEVLAEHHTLVLPSTEEVWGLVVNEALAAGIHAVVTRSCGVAASVEGMRGVFLADPESASLASAMEASRRAWTGPVDQPEILVHTPEAFAQVVLDAVSARR
ncbi:glycosyltransferase [Sinomonas sp. JGH33]|uniref:Glycosyltransferase n=1 Tax=Sinomonas terricola TaxID=3110330 RepID=A0ABU5TBD8_9MICC|nr:glycosyltransferase [Sinomonas sp. JGH33]MEA5457006.1 glycosyltransferase [Sinomonas sp. JGH33]